MTRSPSRPRSTAAFSRTRSQGVCSFAALCLGAMSLAACDARLAVTDANVGGGAGAGGAGQGDGPDGGGGAGQAGTTAEVPACNDGVRNGNEEAVDCGGSGCPECASGNACTNPVECQSSVCRDGVCQPASCDDGVRNGDEALVDCGGPSCRPCLSLCDDVCAVSDALIPIGCDPSAAARSPRSVHASGDGSVVAFAQCEADSSICTPYFWRSGRGLQPIEVTGGGAVAGLSGDGGRALISPRAALGAESLLVSLEGSSLRTGIASEPTLLSADGTVIGLNPSGGSAIDLMRRAPEGAAEVLGELPDRDVVFSGATPDASIIIGHSFTDEQPFVYRQGQLVLGLAGLPEDADGARITALSRDGASLAGLTRLGNDWVSVFRWTEATGLVELAPAFDAPTPGVDETRVAMSDDGSVLAFSAATGAPGLDNFGAFRWTEATGAEELLPGQQSTATLISADGQLILGKTNEGDEAYGAFMWTEAGGARSIRLALENSGVDLRGWTVGPPEVLSRDGRVALGFGVCGDIPTVYRMVLPE